MSKKEKFFSLVTKEFDTITKKERKEFREFIRLNGRQDLTKKENRYVGKQIEIMVENQELMEKYYIFHFLSLVNNQWLKIPLEDTIFKYYKMADKLQEIYMSVFGEKN